MGGSSPLARGLRTAPVVPTTGAGIIPARAGFTRFIPCAHFGIQDHPRSRGVYFGINELDGDEPGSSPLARGLLECVPRIKVVLGIIPARAGFTQVPGI